MELQWQVDGVMPRPSVDSPQAAVPHTSGGSPLPSLPPTKSAWLVHQKKEAQRTLGSNLPADHDRHPPDV